MATNVPNHDFEEVLESFEEAWQSGAAPRLDHFPLSSPDRPLDASVRRELLMELVKIDLEYRWRSKPANCPPWPAGPPRLEDYLALVSDLGPLNQVPVGLIGEEYRVRQRWGDRPRHSEYLARFAGQAAELQDFLRDIDGELARQPAPQLEAVPTAVAMAVPLAIPEVSVASLLQILRQYLAAARLNEITQTHLQGGFADVWGLARFILERDWLTPYQINQLLTGRGHELVMGPYLLLERLGEGGKGQVFRARHRRMNRTVALKIIRKELMTEPETVRRFYQEIQAASQLSHPNIVHAFDAGPIKDTHFLAMEYVQESIDLARLVKRDGPLPPEQACDYVRQAALGLQHIFERNLVHRDIKPSNLLLSFVRGPLAPASDHGPETRDRGPIVKILDLGLARLQRPGDDSGSTLTQEGSVMGTPDYMAPEQVSDPHAVDIRADLYSLGCTFYFLFTGRVPFPGGTFMQKMDRQRWAEPEPTASCWPQLLTTRRSL